MAMAKVTNKKSPTASDNLQKLYQQSDLFLPKTRVNYFVYKPARTLPANAPFHQKLLNSLQLVYYKYQLATGLYMMNGRERALINFLILVSIALTIYHFILK